MSKDADLVLRMTQLHEVLTAQKGRENPMWDVLSLVTLTKAEERAATVPDTPQAVLELATDLVTGERQDDYGSWEGNAGDLAVLWSTFLGKEISPDDIAPMMIMLKLVRAKDGGSMDSYVDIAGYAALGAML